MGASRSSATVRIGNAGPSKDALRRLRDACELNLDDLDLSNIPAGRLKVLARYASTVRAQSIQRMPTERGIATLVAFACSLQASAQDDVLDVLDRLLTDLLARVDKQERQRRLRTIGDLDAAALLLRDIGLIVLDRTTSDHTVRGEIFARWPLERIEQAVATVGTLARPPENSQAPEALLSRYSMVRQFLPLLLETISPHATSGGRAALAAWEFLHRIRRAPSWRRAAIATVKLYRAGGLVKVHPRKPKGGRSTDPDDYPPERTAYAMRAPDQLIRQAVAFGAHIGQFAERLLDAPFPWSKLRQGQRLLRLVLNSGNPGPGVRRH